MSFLNDLRQDILLLRDFKEGTLIFGEGLAVCQRTRQVNHSSRPAHNRLYIP